MKLAYLANVRFPSERAHSAQIAHMCQAFAEQGVEVDLYVNKWRKGGKEATRDFFGFDPVFSVIHIPPKSFFPKVKVSFYVRELIFALGFLFFSNHKSYSIIYSRSEWILFFVSFFVSKEKLVWESHEARLNIIAKKILKKGVKTVVISEGILEDYVKEGLSKEQILVAYDGIDDSFFEKLETSEEARRRLGISSEKPIVMYIGGFDEWKGIDVFCQAAENSLSYQFVAIGGKSEQIEERQSQYSKVKFLGALPYKDLKHNQQAADILVVPNTAKNDLSARHTSPLKLFAHMASGIPLVISDVPSLVSVTGREMVTIFNPDQASSLSEVAKEIFSNIKQKKIDAIKLKNYANQYTWRRRAVSICDFLGYNL